MLSKLISRNIRKAREKAGLTQAEVASRAGLSLGHYNKIESLGTNVKIETIESIARALDTHPLEILNGPAAGDPAFRDALEDVRDSIVRLLGLMD